MNVQLTPAQETRLQQLAALRAISVEQLVADVLVEYLRHIEDLSAAVREGEESAARDGWLTHDEVFERLNQRLRKTA